MEPMTIMAILGAIGALGQAAKPNVQPPELPKSPTEGQGFPMGSSQAAISAAPPGGGMRVADAFPQQPVQPPQIPGAGGDQAQMILRLLAQMGAR